jgi:hypothetical protein
MKHVQMANDLDIALKQNPSSDPTVVSSDALLVFVLIG